MTSLLLATAVLAACNSAATGSLMAPDSASPTVQANRSPTTEPLSTSIASGIPSPAGSADVIVGPDIPVVFTGDDVSAWASAFVVGDKTTAPERLEIASVTVAFGDGLTRTVSQGCASPAERLSLHHTYATAADYSLAVLAATLCQTGWHLNLDSGEGIRVFPAAPASTADWPVCTTRQLTMTNGGSGAGLGHVAVVIHLTNVSRSGCNLQGYPDLQLVSSRGALLPTHAHQATDGDYMFAALKPGRVALGHGDVASVEFGYGDNPSGSGNVADDVACPPARWVRVVLPGNDEYGTASVPTAPCGGFVNVSPIYPGDGSIGFP